MIERKPSKVEELLNTLKLFHLLPTSSSTPASQNAKAIRLTWSAPNSNPAALTHVVKSKFEKPLRRRLRNKHNQSISGELPEEEHTLVTVKPDRLKPVRKVNCSVYDTEWTPRLEQKEWETETTVPLHKRLYCTRTSLPAVKRSRPLQYIHFYRHIQLSSVEKPSKKMPKDDATTPEQILSSCYGSPFSVSQKCKREPAKGRRLGYSLPQVRKITEEITRLQHEKDRKFDAIIAEVMKEFDLSQRS